MTITRDQNGSELILSLNGRLDTMTAPQLEQEAQPSLGGISKLTLDLSKLEYISSAGLRVLLSLQKVMNKQGEMLVRGANETVREVFDITGFSDILTLE